MIADYEDFKEIGAKTLFTHAQYQLLQENLRKKMMLQKKKTKGSTFRSGRVMQGHPIY